MTPLVGVGLWIAALALLPAPLAARITLGAPLVLVPRLLATYPLRGWARRLGGSVALIASLPLLVAYALPPGSTAAAFGLPWLVLCLAAAAGAAWQAIPRLPGILHPRRAAELGTYVALGFLAVGGSFLITDRLGLRPLDFSSTIILLTATHFHFAAFGLLAVASRLAHQQPLLRPAVLGLVIGFPLTAAGFILDSDALNALGAGLVGVSGLGVAAVMLVRGGSRRRAWMLRGAGAALLVGLPMGIAWSWSIWLGVGFLDLELMVRTHGALNAVAVLLAAFAINEVDR